MVFCFLLLSFVFVPLARADIVVETQGVGYPPIRCHSQAQILLLARRAAVLDAYRNALQMTVPKRPSQERVDALDDIVDGKIRSSTLLTEEYLDDGGVQVRVRVLVASPQSSGTKQEISSRSGPRTPKAVTLQEWQATVHRMVQIVPTSPGGPS